VARLRAVGRPETGHPRGRPLKREKLNPSYLWRYLVQQAFQRRHPEAPVIVANAVVILDNWLRSTDRGVEWGSGRSTIWLARRVAHLMSVEHDPTWHARVKTELGSRGLADKVDYRLIEAPSDQMAEPSGHAYAGVADEIEDKTLDFALVDGQMRLRCLEKIHAKLKPGGLLVLDGANRYLPNRFEGGFTTIQYTRSEPLSDEWRRVERELRHWRAMNTSDGLWDTRMWVKPVSSSLDPGDSPA
jgi:SAM-dependent methyltransferase